MNRRHAAPTHEQINYRIGSVPEPCGFLMRKPLTVVEMGLVGAIRIEHGVVEIELVLTDAACVHFSALQRYIAGAASEFDGFEHVTVSAGRLRRDRGRHRGDGERFRTVSIRHDVRGEAVIP
jgi:hypothetical protein